MLPNTDVLMDCISLLTTVLSWMAKARSSDWYYYCLLTTISSSIQQISQAICHVFHLDRPLFRAFKSYRPT
ncbi:uncharacterized protein BDZ83DRAFT_608480 [Colletotrichum acutatum]|uniref:Secreted protein n=1 Tax=Glomerella acutata TaxID=27357 RepID=A0AAD8US91_GLOAC|nr:uncharacterized protein BDZ83DRAFT_608480 [Colletotrichum acutatum]KAK1728568.1 hypothetical protein BDZ83DRAFT_608480 [Colletotrichum acutatum]